MDRTLRLRPLGGRFAVCRLESEAALPAWLPTSGFLSVTRTTQELSILAADEAVPEMRGVVRGYVGFVVEGPLSFDAVGILASLTTPMAEAGIPILAVSTYDTDYLFVPGEQRGEAVEVLTRAGHTVLETS